MPAGESISKQPRRWSFNEDTDYEALDLPKESSYQGEEENEVLDVKMRQEDMQNKRLDPDLLPKAVSKKLSKYSLNKRLVLYVSPNKESRRVVINLDKELPAVVYATESIRFEKDQKKILVVSDDGGGLGLILAGMEVDNSPVSKDRNFYYFIDDSNTEKLVDRNIYANEDTILNLDLIKRKEIVPESFDAVVFQPESYVGKATILEQMVQIKKILKMGGVIYMLTHKKSGAGSYQRMLEEVFGADNLQPVKVGMGGYRLIKASKEDQEIPEVADLHTTVDVSILGKTFSVETLSGLFSKEGLDNGTRTLLESAKDSIKSAKHILDLGCGWGAIGITSALVNPVAKVDMIDIDHRAVETARKNVSKLGINERVTVYQTGDPRGNIRDVDLVLSNPPLHEKDNLLVELFTSTRSVMLKNGEVFIVVENAYLGKFKRILKTVFGSATIHFKPGNSFTIFRSRK